MSNKEFIEQFYHDFVIGLDFKKVREAFADDVDFISAFEIEDSRRMRGADEITAAFSSFPEHVRDAKIVRLEIYETDHPDTLFVEASVEMTVIHNSKRFVHQTVSRFELEDGKIRRWTEYANNPRREAAFA